MDLLTSRRADELDAALSAGAPPADGVARELGLARALQDLGAATAPAPSDEFRAALRSRLVAVAATQGIGATAAAPAPAAVSWRTRLATVAAGLTAGAVAVTGVSAASSMSLPGDPFYGLKRTVEDVQLALADGPAEEGERHLQFARERVEELRALALGRDGEGRDEPLSADDAERVERLLADLSTETRTAQRLVTEAFRAGDEQPVEELAAFTSAVGGELREVLPALPDAVRPRLQEVLTVVADVRTAARDLLLLRDCTTACDPAEAAPTAPAPEGSAAPTAEPCSCPTPAPEPSVAPPPSGGPTTPPASPSTSASPTPTTAPSRTPTATTSPSPTPTPTRTPLLPLPTGPLPTEVPLPTLPPLVPGGTVSVPPLTGDGGVVDGLTDPLLGDGGLLPGLVGVAVVPVPGLLALVARRRRR